MIASVHESRVSMSLRFFQGCQDPQSKLTNPRRKENLERRMVVNAARQGSLDRRRQRGLDSPQSTVAMNSQYRC